ncbi:hypothetical protein [Fodinicola acaciae]|uniref:hypothetical protein n=1 Tax=Fodinicola acaciae TaxID=2681555 RepID=UPI0013D545C8|nr:hypothetical protein [Fodinicola acaciae]
MTVVDVAKQLPEIAALRDHCRALTMLDIIINRAEYHYSFRPAWGPDHQLAELDSGCGDGWSIVFGPDGAFIRGFDHESKMSPYVFGAPTIRPGLIDGLPDEFRHYVMGNVFRIDRRFAATVCLWRRRDDDRWRHGNPEIPDGLDPDGSGWMFEYLVDRDPAKYARTASTVHALEVSAEAVGQVYASTPLTDEIIQAINPDESVDTVRAAAERIGYPI